MSASAHLLTPTNVLARPVKRRRTSTAGLPSPEESPSADAAVVTSALAEFPLLDSSSDAGDAAETERLLARATHVLGVEAAALQHLQHIYASDARARAGLAAAARAILTAHRRGGRCIVSGVGKSGYIGQKLVATLKSLGVGAGFMHACEAAHGDLGDVRADGRDVVLFVTFSGRTPELMNLIPHLPPRAGVMAMTAQFDVEDVALLRERNMLLEEYIRCIPRDTEDDEIGYAASDGAVGETIVIPTPIHEKEEDSFGVCAPTTSTTVALAVADMLALTIAHELHNGKTKEVFKRNHPGGAIGMTHREVKRMKKEQPEAEITVVELPSPKSDA